MCKFMFIILMMVLSLPGLGSADAPPAVPEDKTVYSQNRLFYAFMDLDKKRTVVYQKVTAAAEGKPAVRKIWEMPGWFAVADLSNDGEYLVVGYEGANLLPLNYRRNEIMLAFYKKGKLIRQVRLPEIMPDPKKLIRTVSHYSWRNYQGFTPQGYYQVETEDNRVLTYDVSTGHLVKISSNKTPAP